MAEFAMMLHHAKEDTDTEGTEHTDPMWLDWLRAGDKYRATLNPDIPREAQWMANDWGHRTQLTALYFPIYYYGESYGESWVEEGFAGIEALLSRGVPRSSSYAADLLMAMTLLSDDHGDMALRVIERIIKDAEAGDEWRMLAALMKARETGSNDDCRAVVAMPGDGICHAARAVAKRMLASGPD
ncbi:MAG: hypothetical protein HYS45_02765 [Parcubacteria group bacterium]|nr:hypothetical protein [Parcubacteria group bacterium]MBI2636593.1 hypothetical protein [Parcubacteria group bacterium]